MKDVLASLYSLHPCLIAATQALAAKRMLSGSMITPQLQIQSKSMLAHPSYTFFHLWDMQQVQTRDKFLHS